ncbi:GbsR/MarR family transcriptional regulator [Rubrivirga litoralis]|uniref:MarR family transcriptional regulator n=1 Tax=Rubrivirga litoralis TaxID=3075598 RepID=A0ABU3BNF2_9BACT|nr:MarR family transcriptional regulator [Rubrivirga sp. F394]MDT0630811.1 MarR family transcriptional regulator [Rubrivirga sp. F394]
MPTTLSDEEAQFVDDIGHILEDHGRPRIAGRILGWLLVCEPPHQSFDELVEALGVSKGSVSSMTRLLVDGGLVERVALPGDRRTHFRMAPDAWSRVLSWTTDRVRRMHGAAERGLALVQERSPEADPWRLREMRDLYGIAARQLPEVAEAFENARRC